MSCYRTTENSPKGLDYGGHSRKGLAYRERSPKGLNLPEDGAPHCEAKETA